MGQWNCVQSQQLYIGVPCAIHSSQHLLKIQHSLLPSASLRQAQDKALSQQGRVAEPLAMAEHLAMAALLAMAERSRSHRPPADNASHSDTPPTNATHSYPPPLTPASSCDSSPAPAFRGKRHPTRDHKIHNTPASPATASPYALPPSHFDAAIVAVPGLSCCPCSSCHPRIPEYTCEASI